MQNQNAFILFSAGQDSTATLLLAKTLFKNIHTVSVHYGQHHDLNQEQIAAFARECGSHQHHFIDVPNYPRWVNSALTQTDLSTAQICSQLDHKQLPQSFVPGRNLFFLCIASILASTHQASCIGLGISEVDFAGYPDCRSEFIASAKQTLTLALQEPVQIFTPLLSMNKAEIWGLIDLFASAEEIDKRTKSCYTTKWGEPACGECSACRLRIAGFKEFRSARQAYREKAMVFQEIAARWVKRL